MSTTPLEQKQGKGLLDAAHRLALAESKVAEQAERIKELESDLSVLRRARTESFQQAVAECKKSAQLTALLAVQREALKTLVQHFYALKTGNNEAHHAFKKGEQAISTTPPDALKQLLGPIEKAFNDIKQYALDYDDEEVPPMCEQQLTRIHQLKGKEE